MIRISLVPKPSTCHAFKLRGDLIEPRITYKSDENRPKINPDIGTFFLDNPGRSYFMRVMRSLCLLVLNGSYTATTLVFNMISREDRSNKVVTLFFWGPGGTGGTLGNFQYPDFL